MTNRGDVWVIIPAFNERQTIQTVVKQILSEGWCVVVVDDGSTTSLRQELKGTGAHLCEHIVNLGQGAALQTGIDYALIQGARFLVTFDADGQHDYREIPKLLKPLEKEDCDVVLGSRFAREGKAINISRLKLLALKMAVIFTRLTTNLDVSDTHNGLRALTAQAASQLSITQNRMSHATQILEQIAQKKLRFVEIPVTILYTEYSVGKGQRVLNAFNILWESFVDRMI